MRNSMIFVFLFCGTLSLLAGACGAGEGTLEEIDPGSAPARPTYSEHIAPIMEEYCTACHAPDAQPGEAEGYGYETCAKVKRYWGGVILTVFKEDSMPPGGAQRVPEADRLALMRWYAQGSRCD